MLSWRTWKTKSRLASYGPKSSHIQQSPIFSWKKYGKLQENMLGKTV